MTIKEQYTAILQEELIPAMGCTEPVAIAYAAARARDLLGGVPVQVDLAVSGNIIKNVKSVIVPNTGGLCGISAAAAAGIIAGHTGDSLQVLSLVTEKEKEEIVSFMRHVPIQVKCADTPHVLDICVTLRRGKDESFVRLAGHHTNIVEERKNNNILKQGTVSDEIRTDHSCLSVEKIVAFAQEDDLSEIRSLLEAQIRCNMAIAKEGLRSKWGMNVGTALLNMADNTQTRMRAYAAAASDARMSGCSMPVVVCSGSGNQGITASVPLVVYAQDKGFSQDKLLRALCVSDLVTLHIKSGIGRLSAFCGAVAAGCGAAAGLAFLEREDLDTVNRTIVNALASVSGIVCDGAKPSCAAKIAAALDAGWLAFQLAMDGRQYNGGDGIVKGNVEDTIRTIGIVASEGMRETDKEIIQLMMD